MWGEDAETARLVATVLLVAVVVITIGLPALLELWFWFQKRRLHKDRLLAQGPRLATGYEQQAPILRAVHRVRYRKPGLGSDGTLK
jgi:magnesium-transporting ATPase (P-type)